MIYYFSIMLNCFFFILAEDWRAKGMERGKDWIIQKHGVK